MKNKRVRGSKMRAEPPEIKWLEVGGRRMQVSGHALEELRRAKRIYGLIYCIKRVRARWECGLKEAYDFVQALS